MNKECWVPLNYNGINFPNHSISNLGRIRYTGDPKRARSGEVLKTYPTHNGYLHLGMVPFAGYRKNIKVHRAMLCSWIGYVPNREVNHRNGIKTDNRLLKPRMGDSKRERTPRHQDRTAEP